MHSRIPSHSGRGQHTRLPLPSRWSGSDTESVQTSDAVGAIVLASTARLQVHVPEGVWIGDVSRNHAGATFKVLSVLGDGQRGAGLLEVEAEDIEGILTEIEHHDRIDEVELLEVGDRSAILRFTTPDPMLLTAASAAGLPPEMPFTVKDGRAEWELTGTRDRISELADALRDLGIDFDVEYVGEGDARKPLLSDRQRQIVMAAVEKGYYDDPRDITLSELAEEIGIAKSTMCEILHRAEGAIMKEFADSRDDDAAEDERNRGTSSSGDSTLAL